MTYDIGFVGTGATPEDPDRDGFAMAYKHARGYRRLDDCRLVACADLVPDNAEAFASEFDIDAVHESASEMLSAADLDIVSVCVPPGVHAEVVTECAREGDLAAIHCEKPMATTWRDCQEMVAVCEAAGVQLTINHQRRVGPTYREAKRLLDAGTVGDLERVEVATENLFDAGTHLFDLCDFFVDGATAEWVLAGLDYREENVWFGAHNENQALAAWRYDDGVHGLASMGEGESAVGAYVRLVGSDGRIEIGASDGPPLRVRHARTLGWRAVDTGENIWGDRRPGTLRAGFERVAGLVPGVRVTPDYPSHIDRAIEAVVDGVRTGERPPLAAEAALRGTELVFAAWESVRRRGRVDLPLEIGDNPLAAMVESGDLPVGADTAGGEPAGAEPSTTDD
jgi:predicted dehydrogenase